MTLTLRACGLPQMTRQGACCSASRGLTKSSSHTPRRCVWGRDVCPWASLKAPPRPVTPYCRAGARDIARHHHLTPSRPVAQACAACAASDTTAQDTWRQATPQHKQATPQHTTPTPSSCAPCAVCARSQGAAGKGQARCITQAQVTESLARGALDLVIFVTVRIPWCHSMWLECASMWLECVSMCDITRLECDITWLECVNI